jgi:hypothetical protein
VPMAKILKACFIMVLLFSLFAVAVHFGTGQASTDVTEISKPSVPEFTVQQKDNSSIEIRIKNQPFDWNNAYNYSFFYNVRIRTSNENWTDLYDAEDGYPTQSNSNYTVLSYRLGESAYYPPEDYPLSPSMKVGILPTEGQIDFQVQAYIGYRDRGPLIAGGIMPYVIKGEKSGWSNTQTLAIDENQTPTTSPLPNPPYEISIIIVALILMVTLAGLGFLIYFIKRK